MRKRTASNRHPAAETAEETAEEVTASPTESDDETKAEASTEEASETISVESAAWQRLQEEVAELRDRMLRMQADFDNTRKRLRLQAEQAGQRVLARFVSSLLQELDAFEHALQAANPDRFQDFAMGVTMIHQNLLTALSGSGIEVIGCEGVFDPSVHEVVEEVEDADSPRGTIVEVRRRGYRLGDQVVRAAQVVVTRPPRPADTDETVDQQDG